MPQLFQVLKCYKCSVFQVHQAKKSNKWECKMCGEKQSIKRHYGLGTGKECRLHVQQLNGIRGEIDEKNVSIELNTNSDDELENNSPNIKEKHLVKTSNKSKWSTFIDEVELLQPEHESMYLGNTEVVLEVPVKKRKKFKPPTATFESTSREPSDTAYNFGLDKPVYDYNNYLYNGKTNEPICIAPPKCAYNTDTISKADSFTTHIKVSNAAAHFFDEKVTGNSNIQDVNYVSTYIPKKVNINSKWTEFATEPGVIETTISDKNSSDNTLVNQNNLIESTLESQGNFKENICQFQDKSVENVLQTQNDLIANIFLPSKENLKIHSPKPRSSENVCNLFHLCDDSELDDVLKF